LNFTKDAILADRFLQGQYGTAKKKYAVRVLSIAQTRASGIALSRNMLGLVKRLVKKVLNFLIPSQSKESGCESVAWNEKAVYCQTTVNTRIESNVT